MSDMREEIMKIVTEFVNFKKIRKEMTLRDLWKYVPEINETRQQDLFDFLFPLQVKVCTNSSQNGSPKFKSFQMGYSFCGNRANCKCTDDSINRTMIERYGAANPSHVPDLVKKRHETCVERFGTISSLSNEVVRGKIKSTNMDRYGVTNPFQSEVIKDKIKETLVSRHGVDHPSKMESTQAAIRNASLEKYGVDHHLKSPVIIEKVKTTQESKYQSGHSSREISTRMATMKTNIERYGCDSPMKNQHIRRQTERTNLDRYGNKCVLASDYGKSKTKITINVRYGCDNPMQNAAIRDKVRQTNTLKYGNPSPLQAHIPSASVRKYTNESWLTNAATSTTPYELSIELGVSPETIYTKMREFSIKPYRNKSVFELQISSLFDDTDHIIFSEFNEISPFELDIYLPDHQLAIECNGSYWHSENQGKDRHYHLNKTKLCEENGIQLIHIWEHDWIKNPELIKRRLLSKLGKNERAFARKTQVAKLTTQISAKFLNQHHLQGTCPASVKYGLYEQDELVAVMTLGKSRFSKNYEWELLRYCSTKQVIGGAGKLFKHFQREHQPKSVVSYSDKMWNTGNLYKQLGFEYSHTSAPSYYYTKNYRDFSNRVQFQKHKLHKKLEHFDPNLTEWENMQANGFDRIWDCGSDVWVFINDM